MVSPCQFMGSQSSWISYNITINDYYDVTLVDIWRLRCRFGIPIGHSEQSSGTICRFCSAMYLHSIGHGQWLPLQPIMALPERWPSEEHETSVWRDGLPDAKMLQPFFSIGQCISLDLVVSNLHQRGLPKGIKRMYVYTRMYLSIYLIKSKSKKRLLWSKSNLSNRSNLSSLIQPDLI